MEFCMGHVTGAWYRYGPVKCWAMNASEGFQTVFIWCSRDGVGIVSDRLSGVVGVSVWGISSVVVASGD